jgi:late competence protein required for DNA uptake (superfamily II DNA/RNA helicase)
MEYDEPISSVAKMNSIIKTSKSLSSCKVCGTESAQIHYGGICCVSCKMFFRRNSQFDLVRKLPYHLIAKFFSL